MYMYATEHVWIFIFWLYCISCTYRKRKQVLTQKKKYQENLKTSEISELLPSACPAPEIKILSVLVKFSWKAEIELSS